MAHQFEAGNDVGPRWQPGQSGNPAGRPRTSIKALIRKKAEEVALKAAGVPALDLAGNEQTYADAVVTAIYRDALKGDASSKKLILECIDGDIKRDDDMPGDAVVQIVDNI